MLPDHPRCPVCSEGFDAPPVACPRCQAPHHRDCWEYVPGCARFGCSDSGLPELADAPRVYRLAAARATCLSTGAVLLEAGLVGNVLVMLLIFSAGPASPLAVPFAYTIGAVLLGLACLVPAFVLSVRLAVGPDGALLARLHAEGDRRLCRALEARVGNLLPVSPGRAALGLVVVAETWILAGLLWTGDPARVLQDFPVFLGLGAALGALVYYPVLQMAAWMVGSQRILVHRLGAGLGKDKAALPGGAAPGA